ncbi:MAG TPA: isocitrate lyase/PEP mutase family protein [Pseudolabrys sp.]|uniref:isocitrate lyase/PEP mutase family protein n=1 Tax=Pseudolabrys sp. TaxID=1960880 RepID=UPI002DDCDB3B|nr:isocitrate lyase/PEP mutase family protein [Pseudolabrys sp.]HEV2627036.1 isocitrate lyase/PEP mutase family protein [Pseudolabrys sp.]
MSAKVVTPKDRRLRYRALLEQTECRFAADVFDPMSARMAAGLGFKVGMLAGSVASMAILGAPDLCVITMSEFAALVRRICRASDLPIMVDADHGYGNALNVMRTVEELETAGLAALTIEDTLLPPPFDGSDKALITPEEGERKIKAAVSARCDDALVVIARTAAASISGIDDAVARAVRYADAGADALFFSGIRSAEQLAAIRERVRLPILLGAVPPTLSDPNVLATYGVRICLQGHRPFLAAMRACHEALAALANSTPSADIKGLDGEALAQATRRPDYATWTADYLKR